jgi:hypothetical protein
LEDWPNILMIAREYFPEWSDDDLGFVIWNETAYPFNLVHDGREEAIRLQLNKLRRRLAEDPTYILGAV